MKILLLNAHSGEPHLVKCKEHIVEVLKELGLEVDSVELQNLPYFKYDQVSPVAAMLAERIVEAKGVIAITSVHVGSMHSSMQSFFEHFTRYKEQLAKTPLLSIAYSEFIGERQVAYQILQSWSILGGTDGGASFWNKHIRLEDALENIERQLETYYRLLKQSRRPLVCSEHYFYKQISEMNDLPQKEQSELPVTQIEMPKVTTVQIAKPDNQEKQVASSINLTTQEENISEIAQFLRNQIDDEDAHEFTQITTSTYKKPQLQVGREVVVNKPAPKIGIIPHHFVAQHDKSLNVVIQYHLIDTDEKGTIIIRNGDCIYEEQLAESPTVEMILSEDIFTQIIKKQLTYQKAFMIGKLKVKGNFSVLAKLDQSFKAL